MACRNDCICTLCISKSWKWQPSSRIQLIFTPNGTVSNCFTYLPQNRLSKFIVRTIIVTCIFSCFISEGYCFHENQMHRLHFTSLIIPSRLINHLTLYHLNRLYNGKIFYVIYFYIWPLRTSHTSSTIS